MEIRIVRGHAPYPRPPPGGVVYGIREADDWAGPATIENNVTVNRWGYLIVSEPLPALDGPGDPYLVIPADVADAIEVGDLETVARFLATGHAAVG